VPAAKVKPKLNLTIGSRKQLYAFFADFALAQRFFWAALIFARATELIFFRL
jgi:hypothetical protein